MGALRKIHNIGQPLRLPDGTLAAGVDITFTLTSKNNRREGAWDALDYSRELSEPITVFTNDQGEFEVWLWPNNRGTPASYYLCTVGVPGANSFAFQVSEADQPLLWAEAYASGSPLTPQEISELKIHVQSPMHIPVGGDPGYLLAKASAEDHDTSWIPVTYEPADGNIQGHIASTDNPHLTTAEQVGADPVGSAAAVNQNLSGHTAQTTTAHGGIVATTDPRLSDDRAPIAHDNSRHLQNYITATEVTYQNLNSNGQVGTGATQVSRGNHDHTEVYEPRNTNIQSHISSTSNPHNVTLAQLGAAAAGHDHTGVYEPRNTNIQAHISSTGNPHNVTLAQLGAAAAGHDHTGVYDPVGTAASTLSAHTTTHNHALLHGRQHAVTSVGDHTFPGGGSLFLRADGTWAEILGMSGVVDGGTAFDETFGLTIDGGIA